MIHTVINAAITAASGNDEVSSDTTQDAHLPTPVTSTTSTSTTRSPYRTRGSTRSADKLQQQQMTPSSRCTRSSNSEWVQIQSDRMLARSLVQDPETQADSKNQSNSCDSHHSGSSRVSQRGGRRRLNFSLETTPSSFSAQLATEQTSSSSDELESILSSSRRPVNIRTIANHRRLLRHVPHSMKSRFQLVCAKFFNQYMAAAEGGNDEAVTSAIANLLLIPSYMFVRLGGGKKYKRKHAHKLRKIALSALLDRMNGEEAANKATEVQNEVDQERNGDESRHENELEVEQDQYAIGRISKAVSLIRTNHVGRAAKQLAQSRHQLPQQDTEELVEQLAALHPQCDTKGAKPTTSVPITCSHTTVIDVKHPDEDRAFCQFIRRLSNGSAPGLSGWTGDMLTVLLSSRDCKRGLARLICDINNGTLPESAKQYLLPSHLIGIPKSNGSIRPISMGEVFYRAAALYGISQVTEAAASILSPIQFGVGVPAGCEQAVHRLQHLLTQCQPQRLAGIAVDFKNAFNERNRDDILQSLYAEPALEPIWKLAHWAYSSPSPLWIRECDGEGKMIQPHQLQSKVGVKQGDPLGSLLFALSVKAMYVEAVVSDPTGSISAVAFLDDCTLVGPPDMRLINALSVLKRLAQEGGLEMNMSKTKFLWLHSEGGRTHSDPPISPEVKTKLDELGMSDIEVGAAWILGAPIGSNEGKRKALVESAVKEQQAFFDLLQSKHMPLQETLTMLRECGIPRFNYLARTTHSSVLLPSAQQFDAMVMDVVHSKFQVPIIPSASVLPLLTNTANTRAHKQLVLPIKMTGLGLRSAAFTLDIAYISSIIRSILEDEEWWTHNYPHVTTNPHLLSQWQQSIEHIRAQLNESDMKRLCPPTTNFTSFIHHIHRTIETEREEKSTATNSRRSKAPNLTRLQHLLTYAVHRKQFDELKRLAGDKRTNPTADIDMNRLQHLRHHSSLSHLWLTVNASDDSLLLSDDVMKLSIRTRLGLETHTGNSALQCVCSKVNAFQHDPHHAFTCIITRSKANIARHNLILHRLALWTRRANITTEIEASHLSSNNRLRPDLVLTMKSGMKIIDVAVVHPFTQAKLHSHSSAQTHTTDSTDEEGRSLADSNTTSNNESNADERRNGGMSATEAVEKMKRRKYATLIRDYGASFSTAVAETTGGLGKEFRDLLDDIAHEALGNESGWEKEEMIAGATQAVAVAIQIGNARLIHANRNQILKRQLYSISRGQERKSRQRKSKRRASTSTSISSVPAPAFTFTSQHSHRPAAEFSLPSSSSVASMC